MDWYTIEGAQELANKRGKPVCLWQPIPFPCNLARTYWIYDPSDRVRDHEPAGFPGRVKQEKHSLMRVIRPQKI